MLSCRVMKAANDSIARKAVFHVVASNNRALGQYRETCRARPQDTVSEA